MNPCAKFRENRTNSNGTAACYVKLNMAAAASLDFNCHYRFENFSISYVVMSLPFKFHQDQSIKTKKRLMPFKLKCYRQSSH